MQQRARRPQRAGETGPTSTPTPAPASSGRVMRSVDVRSLQQTAGNRVARRAALGALQRSVQVGAADHPSEAEADRVARDVMSDMGQTDTAQRAEEDELQMKRDDSVQRMEGDDELQAKRDDSVQRAAEEEELQAKHDDSVQRAAEEEELQAKFDDSVQRAAEEEELQAKRDDSVQREAAGPEVGHEGGAASHATGDAINRAKGGGRGIPENVRGKMESSFGADFSNVRVHSDGESQSLNKKVGAKAFTTGSDIFFGKSGFNPASSSGQELLAHELTHVVQQGAARSLDEDAHSADDGHQH
ncbi:MAG: DUF4157 domain-containing protein [Dehalococcoidia bacterium]|nr:DUF4157 domain-containing protein [Dehalococcoidia bacterium]